MRILLIIVLLFGNAFFVGCLLACEYCDKIQSIKALPFKNEKVTDEVYNALIGKGEEVIPCLIDKLTDTTVMNDPRKAPAYKFFTVGDAAFFVLLDVSGQPLEKFIPPSVKEIYKQMGVYAYFQFVQKIENREKLQSNWQVWLQKQSPEKGGAYQAN